MGLYGSAPKIEAEKEPPTYSDPAVLEARERERKLALLRKGRRSTILTSERGIIDKPAPKIGT